MKTILITGGAGYIGSHTVLEILSNKNYDVLIVDDFSNSNPLITNRIHQIAGRPVKVYHRDSKDQFDDIFANHKIDGIIHFAAYKSVGESVNNPLMYYDNNINSLINILDCCKAFDIRNIVFSSSCSLYGNVKELPVNENTPISEPESPYAYTKLIGERIIKDFCKVNSSINVVALRYFNPVGAHISGLIGESPINKPNNIIPIICDSVSGNEFKVFGNDYDTPDGTCIRDYVHVSDIAKAHLLSIEYMMNNPESNFEIFNLGSDNGISVLELINAFEKYNNVKVNYKIGERREGDIVKIYSDSTKAKKLLKWNPQFTIEDMVKTAWLWYKNRI